MSSKKLLTLLCVAAAAVSVQAATNYPTGNITSDQTWQTGASQFARAYGHSRHLSFRYGGKVNLLFLDGSVRRYQSEDLFNGTQVVNDEVYWAGLE